MAVENEPDSALVSPGGAEGSRLAVRRNRVPLFSVLSANAVSQVGDMMVAVAMPWFVLETTGSVVSMGLAGAVVGVGALLASVVGGPLADRFGLRRASLVSDITAGAAVATIPLLYWADMLPFGAFLALVLVISVLNAPGDLARRALMPTLARWAGVPLERANSVDTAIPRFAQLAGPVLGGVLVVVVGAANVLLLNAVTFFVSALAVWWGVPSRGQEDLAVPRASDATARDHQVFADCRLTRTPVRQYLDDLQAGFRFVRSSGLLLSFIVIATVANLLEKPLMSVVAPVYAEDYYGSATTFGAILGAFGAGALVGTIGFGAVAHRLPPRPTFLGGLLLAPAVLFGALALTPPLGLLLLAVAFSGVLFGPLNTLMATAIQETTPPELLARVFGTASAVSMMGIPVGAAVVGVVVAKVGLVPTILGMGGVYLAMSVVMAFNPLLAGMTTPRGNDSDRQEAL